MEEVKFDAKKHAQVKRGGIAGKMVDGVSVLCSIVYDMPPDSAFGPKAERVLPPPAEEEVEGLEAEVEPLDHNLQHNVEEDMQPVVVAGDMADFAAVAEEAGAAMVDAPAAEEAPKNI